MVLNPAQQRLKLLVEVQKTPIFIGQSHKLIKTHPSADVSHVSVSAINAAGEKPVWETKSTVWS